MLNFILNRFLSNFTNNLSIKYRLDFDNLLIKFTEIKLQPQFQENYNQFI